jgi:succinoglycan biosynthesis transport protein ExoP
VELEQNVNISDYVAAIRRRRKLAAAIGMVCVTVGAVVAVALHDTYRSTVVFGLKDTTSPEANRASYQDQYVSGLTRYVLSDANKRQLIQKFNPYPRLADDPGKAMGRVDADVNTEMITGAILDPDSGHNKEINTGFSVSYNNEDPKVANEVAGWLMQAFQKGARENALVPIAAQANFLSGEADRARSRITELESKLADFKKQNFDQLPDSAQANLNARNQTEQELSQIDSNISTQQQNRIFLMQQLQTAQSTGGGADLASLQEEYKRKLLTYDTSHPDMIALRRQIESARQGGVLRSKSNSLQAELQSQEAVLAEARMRYSDDYPDVRRLQDNIQSLKARIAAGERVDPSAGGDTPLVVQLNSQIHATDTQIAGLQARRAELNGKLNQFESRLALTPRVERDFEALNRDLGVARQQYDDTLKQKSQAETMEAGIRAGTADKFELLAAPSLPGAPSAPNRLRIVLIGALIGAVLALVAAIGAEILDGSIRGSRDVRRILALTPLAVIPEIQNSVYKRRRARQVVTFASCVLVAIPIMFIFIRAAIR